MNTIHDHGENDPLDFTLTPAERDAAAFAQAQLRFDVALRNDQDRAVLARETSAHPAPQSKHAGVNVEAV